MVKNTKYIERFLQKADKAIDDGIKKADEAIGDAVEFGGLAADQAKKTSAELQKRAKQGQSNIKKQGLKKINDGIESAKQITSNTERDLDILEKLGSLRESGVITEKEFQAKKKKILARI